MPGLSAESIVEIGLALDPASLGQVQGAFERVLVAGLQEATVAAGAAVNEMGKKIVTGTEGATKATQNVVKQVGLIGPAAKESMSTAERQTVLFTDALLGVGRAVGLAITEIQRVSQIERRSSIDATAAAQDAARIQIQELRNTGNIATVEAQRSVVVARGAAKSRVIIVQELARTIGRLEKGLGTVIEGVAKTSVGAVSKIFSSLAGVFRHDNGEISSAMKQAQSEIQTGMRSTNAQLTEGVSASLNKRETLIRESFLQQESTIKRSAVRQEEALAGLRAGTQTGVLGAANRGLNIGAFLGGFAVLAAAKSTFSVGSDFVRGLTVLQTQLGLTGDQMKSVRQLSIDLGNDITLPGVSALDAAIGIQVLTKTFSSLGPAAVDAAQKAAKGTLQLARATGSSAEDAAAIIGAAVNVFKIDAGDAVAVADSFAGALSKAAGVSFTDFKDSFTQGATVFEEFVGPVESAKNTLLDFNTTLAVLAKNGITGSNAGAALKQFFLQANKLAPAAQQVSTDLAKKVGEQGNIFFDANGKARAYSDSLRILRGGLQGLSDQQRTNTLTTLFGSRSIVAANALVNESQADYDALRKSIQQQGLAAKIAAAQNTGFAGALDALKSIIETAQILLFEKLNPILRTITLGFAILLNNILSGKGSWEIVRRGLLGVAAGLGAVIAVKAGVEVLKLLSTTLSLLLTPFGAVLLVAGALGAIISIGTDRSQAFRDALSNLLGVLKDVGREILGKTKVALSAIGDVITRDVIPFLQSLATWVGQHLLSAFDATVRFITGKVIPALQAAAGFIKNIAVIGFKATVDFIRNTVIPAFQAFVDFMLTTVVPAAIGLGKTIGSAFTTAFDAVSGFWSKIQPVLQPIIDGFATLGGAIASAFGGDFSKLGSGFAAVGSGFAASFSQIGKNLLAVLGKAWDVVSAFLKTTFSGAHLISLAGGFLNLVEWIGHTLGAIVTNPTFVRAIATIAGAVALAAGLIALRFIEGFAKAFASNLVPLVHLLGAALSTAFVEALKFVFNNPVLATIIVVGLLAIFQARSLIQSLTLAGQKAGGGFFKGLSASLKTSVGSAGGLLQGLFGGAGSVLSSGASGVFKGVNTEVLSLQKQLRALGSTTLVSPATADAAKKELAQFGLVVSDTQKKGLLLRDSFKQVGSGIATAFSGAFKGLTGAFKGVVSGIGAALSATNAYNGPATSGAKAFVGAFKASMVGSGAAIADGFRGIFTSLKETAAAQGTSVGALVGKALGKAAIGAVAIAVGFQAGKAEGAAGGSGIISALLSGVTAGALIGGPWGAAVGVLTAGAGLIGAAFGRAEAKAKAFREEVAKLTTSFAGDLVKAIESGQIALNGLHFPKGFGVSDVLGTGDAIDQAVQSLADKLKPEQVKAILDANVGGIRGIVKMLQDANGNVDRFSENFRKQFLANTTSTDKFRQTFGTNAAEIADVLARIDAPGGFKSIQDFIDSGALADLSKGAVDAIRNNKGFLDSILATSSAVTTEGRALTNAAQDALNLSAATAKVPPIKVAPDPSEHRGIEGLEQQVRNLGKSIGDLARRGELREVTGQALDVFTAFLQLGGSVDDAQKKLADLHLPAIPQEIITRWQTDIDNVGKKVQALQDILDAEPQTIADRINAALGDKSSQSSTQGIIDANIVDAQSITSGISGALAAGVDTAFGGAQFRNIMAAGSKEIGNIVSAGITGGLITDQASASKILDPLKADLLKQLDPKDPNFQAASDAINSLFTTALSGIQVDIDEVHSAEAAAKFQKAVQDYLTNHPLTTRLDAEMFVKLDNASGSNAGVANLIEGDARKFGFPKDTKTQILDQLVPTQTQAAAAGTAVGTSFSAGFAGGIHSQESQRIVAAAAVAITNTAKASANTNLHISSPSKEMMKTGGFFAEGFARGIESGIARATTAAQALAQSAADAAHAVMGDNSLSFSGGSPNSFVSNFGQPTSANTNVTNSGQPITAPGTRNVGGALIGNLTIVEAQSPRQTARKVVTELRTQQILTGVR